ncbi:uncharacterized protein YacL [Virgibacillus campisalis]|uniref:Uncharacterized protein YacL n=1 Tax=Virgibacillus alimentarius TaxID=698769 RepID=A0ABS4SA90_9BACI|nr:hypothetical protein [Virgibacillus sp.]MBP2258431.1 uncharacterized protein YacL [Virgibacillus alimentarius]HLR68227.1 hypothetical protein [Virgibacillus sp.]
MIHSLKQFLYGIAGVITGIIIVYLLNNEEINWDTIGVVITVFFLILLFRLGLSLYKK